MVVHLHLVVQSPFIEFVTIASTGNSQEFGDLIDSRELMEVSCGNATRGVWMGGGDSPSQIHNMMQYIQIQTLGNAQ